MLYCLRTNEKLRHCARFNGVSVKDVKLIFQQIYLLDVKVLTPNLFEVT